MCIPRSRPNWKPCLHQPHVGACPGHQIFFYHAATQLLPIIIKCLISCSMRLSETPGAFDSKLSRLQLSEDLERALDLEFQQDKQSLNPQQAMLLSSKFDINAYINDMFPDEQSLNALDDRITEMDDRIGSLDLEIKACIREQAYASDFAREELRKVNEESAKLVDKIESVKEKAEVSEGMVQSICSEIRSLDFAKRNITFTITSLKRMSMLITALEQLRGFCIKKQYREAARLIDATDEFCQYFKEYKDIPQINDLQKERDHLCNQLRLQIFEDFNKIDKGQLPDLLYDACFVIDAIQESQKVVKNFSKFGKIF